ncbi:hypothetical protein N2152v2_006553 [Parachlorella kessleri]
MSTEKLPRRPLGSTGLHISVLGFGASPLGGVFHVRMLIREAHIYMLRHKQVGFFPQGLQDIDEEAGVQSVVEAFNRGINFFDTSPFYGDTKSEMVLGKGLAKLPRDQIVVATKVGRYGSDVFDFSAERVTASVRESLGRLQLTYIDLIQTHDIEFGSLDQVVNETIPALLKLKEEGLVRHIGITGLPLKIYRYVLDRVAPGSVQTVLSYCHYCLNDRSLLNLIPYCKERNIGVINASALSMGLLTPQGPPSWHPAPQQLKEAAKAAAEHARSRGVSIARLAIMDAVKNEDIATTLVGLCTPEQVNENVESVLQALGLVPNPQQQLEQEVLQEVEQILQPVRDMTWPSGRPENN